MLVIVFLAHEIVGSDDILQYCEEGKVGVGEFDVLIEASLKDGDLIDEKGLYVTFPPVATGLGIQEVVDLLWEGFLGKRVLS